MNTFFGSQLMLGLVLFRRRQLSPPSLAVLDLYYRGLYFPSPLLDFSVPDVTDVMPSGMRQHGRGQGETEKTAIVELYLTCHSVS